MGNVGDSISVFLILYLWFVVTNASPKTGSEGRDLESSSTPRAFLTNEPTTPDAAHITTSLTVPTKSLTWLILVFVLLSVLSLAVFFVLVKRRVFQSYQSNHRENLLPDGDTTSQFSHDGMLTPYITQYGRRNPQGNGGQDEDGFIEDNYITSSEQEGAEKEEELQEESDDELYIDF